MLPGHANYDFSGRVAVITGGGGGFGRAIARQLLDAGASVVLWNTREQAAQAVGMALAAEVEVSFGCGQRLWVQGVDITDDVVKVLKEAHPVASASPAAPASTSRNLSTSKANGKSRTASADLDDEQSIR